ncbi:ribosomal RNA large subunit methyltransferase H [mine drainage metagenome]|uniref:Ribosomal RNA large subunit methyltransferase H n=1 Tax=mine drainage metagenome TaxID=410659 RepID=A0A1J5Q1J9_9ZZZZ
MRLVVIAIGRLKQGPERELAERYRERFDDIGRKLGFRDLEIHEIPESRARDAVSRIAEEAAAISAAIPAKSLLIALDGEASAAALLTDAVTAGVAVTSLAPVGGALEQTYLSLEEERR